MRCLTGIKFFLVFGIFLGILTIVPLHGSYAANTSDPDGCFSTKDSGGKDTFLTNIPASYTLEQPLGAKAQVANLGEYVNLVYRYALGIVGIIATVLIMAGGLWWMNSNGNEQSITQAKEIITSSIVGLAIALFSYSILYLINPKLLSLDMAVFKIPIPKEEYNCTVPELVNIVGTDGSGGLESRLESTDQRACVSVAMEINWIVSQVLPQECPTCTIHVLSSYRTGGEQAKLYNCYQQAITDGFYSNDGKSKIKEGCPAGCGNGCNIADKPCCSDHNRGLAVDVCLKVNNMQYNNVSVKSNSCADIDVSKTADGGGDPTLKANQDLLRKIMEKGRFKRDSKEWWHFTIQGDCNSSYHLNEKYCVADNGGFDDSYYCEDVRNHQYAKAQCIKSIASCVYLGSDYVVADDFCRGDYEFSVDPTIPPNCEEIQPWTDTGSG